MKNSAGCALITGGSRGIGNAIARQLARDGIHVVLIARDEKVLKAECESIILEGGSASYFQIDFLLPNCMDVLRELILRNKLSPNILVNGLGGGFGSKTFDSVDVYKEVMWLNFFVPHKILSLIVDNAKKIGWGRFICIGTLAINHKSASAPYVAAKAALMAYMKVVAKDLAKISDNILVCAVSPGLINVEGKFFNSLLKSDPENLKLVLERNSVAAGRLGQPDEVARVVSFLCNQNSTYLNGCNIEIDGGASN